MVLESIEAERAIEALEALDLSQVGCAKWLRQHLALQKLNLQAHSCVQNNLDNHVLEALVSHDKLRTVVHELLVIEVWREKVLSDPEVFQHLANNFSIRGYHTAFQEAVLCNLLEVVLYHDYAAESCGDTLIELVDYCVRRVRWLVGRSLRQDKGKEEEEDEEESGKANESVKEFKRQLEDLEWRCSVASVSVLRFLCEHIKQLPLGVMTRMLDTHDVPCLVVPLIENPPWTRRTDKGQWEKLKDQKWEKVAPKDLLLLTPLEAQPWLCLFNLLCEGDVRQRYHFHSFRKEQVLRVRKYLNATLTDQLPVLCDLQRVLDELVIMDAPAAATTTTSLIMEAVAEVRDDLLAKTDWNEQRRICLDVNFQGKETKDDPLVRELAGLYADDEVEALLSGPQAWSPSDEAINTSNDAQPETIDEQPPVAPETRQLYPSLVTLYLHTGTLLELCPVSKSGTEQQTSKGAFLRFQLQKKQPESDSTSLNLLLDERGLNGSIIKMNVRDSYGRVYDIYSKPLKLAAVQDGAESWAKLGSLKSDAVAQIQCTYTAGAAQFALASCFISLKQH